MYLIFSRLLAMDHPVTFENAAIGRLVPVDGAPGSAPMGTSPAVSPPQAQSPTSVAVAPASGAVSTQPTAATGCQKLSSYSFDADAVKFGDAPNSHVLVSFRRKNLLQKDFTVELQFRTFYPSGMLYLVPGGGAKQRQYLVAYLLDGILQVVYKGRNKLEVSLPNTYNDGSWHTVNFSLEY